MSLFANQFEARSKKSIPLTSLVRLLLSLSLLFSCVGLTPGVVTVKAAGTALINDEEFGVKEYDEFHRILHHLQHEALPKNDIAAIRERAKELIKLGDAIVTLGVPEGTKPDVVSDFKKELDVFKKALVRYGAAAESGSDNELKSSYGAVHDSFEELVSMLPRKK